MKHLAIIDPHVHLRGEEYDINYVAKGLIDMKVAGIIGFGEMPNTKPPLTWPATFKERFDHVLRIGLDVGWTPRHVVHMGLTNQMTQVQHVLEYISKSGLCVSDKVFYTHSTGDMGILDPEIQRQIWQLKGAMNYRGVSIGHFEDEKQFVGQFDWVNPVSQSLRQCEKAETVQVEAQIKNAFDARFQGTFYVAHVSSPDTVDFLTKARQTLPFEVVIEATFHHLFLNWDDYKYHGNLVKMNPPLRGPISQKQLLSQLLDGKIDIIGTDHAPHPLVAKLGQTPPSGIPALPFWPKGIELLLNEYKMKPGHLAQLTFHKANELFKLGLKPTEIETEYEPERWEQYGWNPFSRVDGTKHFSGMTSEHLYDGDRMPHPGPEIHRGPGPRPQKLGL